MGLKNHLARGLLLACVLLTWELLPRLGVVEPDLLPPFSEVVRTLITLLARASFQRDIVTTTLEIFTSFLIAVPLGAVLGLLIAEHPYVARVFDPLLFFLFSIP